MKTYVQYGCGLSAPEGWLNFDASPTLRIQKVPVIGNLLSSKLNAVFPANVKYGDIIKGLPGIDNNSCDGVYCSHVLEHLSLEDFRIALANTYKILKPGGIFRCVVPDLESLINNYRLGLESGDSLAAIKFIRDSGMGIENRKRGLKDLMQSFLGNSHHLWLWDNHSLVKELEDSGFRKIRRCSFNDCEDSTFNNVEDFSRFRSAVAIECRK